MEVAAAVAGEATDFGGGGGMKSRLLQGPARILLMVEAAAWITTHFFLRVSSLRGRELHLLEIKPYF